jgi:hypothetical protein
MKVKAMIHHAKNVSVYPVKHNMMKTVHFNCIDFIVLFLFN